MRNRKIEKLKNREIKTDRNVIPKNREIEIRGKRNRKKNGTVEILRIEKLRNRGVEKSKENREIQKSKSTD